MPTLDDFSNELLLSIFPNLTLSSLIAAQGVCTLWRRLVPLADIDPARRGLLDLYFTTIQSPVFERSRPWLLQNLRPFNREAYIDALLDQHDYLPRDFYIWILEWPAKAVISGCWPGLPDKFLDAGESDDVERTYGCNWLGRIPPIVHTVQINQIGPIEQWVEEDVPALLVWEDGYEFAKTWLVLAGKPVCNHAVYVLADANYYGQGEFGPDSDDDEESDLESEDTEEESASESDSDDTQSELEDGTSQSTSEGEDAQSEPEVETTQDETADSESNNQSESEVEQDETTPPDSEGAGAQSQSEVQVVQGVPEETAESESESTQSGRKADDLNGNYAYHGVYSSWTYWLKRRLGRMEAKAELKDYLMAKGKYTREDETGYCLDPNQPPAVTGDAWFRANRDPHPDRVWAGLTGRRSRPPT